MVFLRMAPGRAVFVLLLGACFLVAHAHARGLQAAAPAPKKSNSTAYDLEVEELQKEIKNANDSSVEVATYLWKKAKKVCMNV